MASVKAESAAVLLLSAVFLAVAAAVAAASAAVFSVSAWFLIANWAVSSAYWLLSAVSAAVFSANLVATTAYWLVKLVFAVSEALFAELYAFSAVVLVPEADVSAEVTVTNSASMSVLYLTAKSYAFSAVVAGSNPLVFQAFKA